MDSNGGDNYEQIDATTYRPKGQEFQAIFGGTLGIRIVGANGEVAIPAGHVLSLSKYTSTWKDAEGVEQTRTYYSARVQTEAEFNGADDTTVEF